MQKRMLPLLLALLLCAGCQRFYPDEYLSVQEHEAPFAYRETVTVPAATETEPPVSIKRVSRAYDIREAIQDMVMSGEESGELLLTNYAGDVVNDMQNMFGALLSDSPKLNYAMDRFDWSLKHTERGTVVRIAMKLRLTPQEIQAIETRLFPNPALSDIYSALRQQLSAFTVQVSGYEDTDFVALLDDYILHHPDEIAEAPGLLASVYPDRGRVRVVELHFVYQTDRETLRQHREETRSALNLIRSQLSGSQSPDQIVETLYKYLVPSIRYENSEQATVYTQMVSKVGSSRTMASVVEYLCGCAGLECEIVAGERNGESWFWNRILCDGQWKSVDLHAAALEGRSPVLLPSAWMEGYSYDHSRYPEIELPEPSDTEATEATEPTEPTEPDSSQPVTEPPQPSETGEAPETTELSEPVPSESGAEPTPTASTEPTEATEPGGTEATEPTLEMP